MPTNDATSVGATDPAEASRGHGFRLVCGTRPDLAEVAWAELATDPKAAHVKSNALRQVWRIERGGEVFYAKVFRTLRGWEQWRLWLRGRPEVREWRAGDGADRLGVPAIRFAALIEPARPGGEIRAVLVSRAVSRAITLADFWERVQALPEPADRAVHARAVIDAVARLVANAHAMGFLHRDTYSDNVLIVQDDRGDGVEAFYADLGQARVGRAVGERQAAANLAELVQWFRTRSTVGQRMRFLSAYLAQRHGWGPSEARSAAALVIRKRLTRQVDRLSQHRRRRLIAKRDSRIFRNNTHFHTLTLGGGWRGTFTLRFRRRDMAPRPSQPDRTPAEWIEWSRKVVGQGSDAAGIAQSLAALGLAGRIDRPRGPWERVAWTLAGSPARRAFRDGHRKRNRDLPVTAPVALLERRVGRLVAEVVLVTERAEGRCDA